MENHTISAFLIKIGIRLNSETGNIYYTKDFNSFKAEFSLVFIRHGETFGNCGQSTATGQINYQAVKHNLKDRNKRVFQGNVDTPINQLTQNGIMQSHEVTKRLEMEYLDKNFVPDIIFHSPLARAQQTGLPFVDKFKFHEIYHSHPEIREMAFGAWENKRLCDFDAEDPCHSFYLEQNALVKSGFLSKAENFCETLLRAYRVLTNLNDQFKGKNVILFSHSMFGAACGILLGKGNHSEDGEHIVFDGNKADGSSNAIPHATPIKMTSDA